MRAIRLTNILLASTTAALVAGTSHAATIDAVSAIAGVTVYTDGAAIRRHLTADIPAGSHTLVLRGLPSGVDPASIRVEGSGSSDLGIVSVDSRVAPGDPRPAVDGDLERRLTALRDEREGVAGAIEAAEGQKATIQRYGQASPEKLGADSAPLDVERWPQAWRAIGEGLADVNEVLHGLHRKATALDEEVAALEHARPPSPRPGVPKRDIVVAVDAPVAMRADLDVTYQVASAAWTPAYDAVLTTSREKPRLELARRANIQQRTGEDWTGVSVALSTVRLKRGTAAPDLPMQSLTLYDLQEAAMDAARQASPTPAPAGVLRSPRLQGAGEAKVVAAPVLATLDAGAYEATFTVPGTVDVPQDGTLKSFALTTRTLEPTLGARATPALDPTAYLEASFTNDEDAPLLPGDVALRRDGTFVGTGRLAFVAPAEKVRLGFGADDRLKVTRVPVARKENDGGFFANNRSETQDFRTLVKNGHAFALRVTLVDRLPVSENSAIVVTPLDTNTPATEKAFEDKRGVMAWVSDLKPGEQKDVRLGWRIRWPADRELRRQ